MRVSAAVAVGSAAALFVLCTHLLKVGAGVGLAALGDRALIATYAGAALLGVANLSGIHLRRAVLKRRGWANSLLLLGALVGYGAVVITQSPDGRVANWVFLHALSPLYATMYGLVAFFITSAAYRAFRARSAEAAVLLCAAVIVLLGETPLGDLWRGLGGLGGWLLHVPVTGAYRAIQIGATLGAMFTALRVLLGIERAHLG